MILAVIVALTSLQSAFAQPTDDPPIVVRDPASFVATLAFQMDSQGAEPLRATFLQLFGGSLGPQFEAQLVVYERAIGTRRAIVSRRIEDVTLSDAVRSIYHYHYYGQNLWIFTRVDFVRIDNERWAVSSLAFNSDWATIYSPSTPSFTRN